MAHPSTITWNPDLKLVLSDVDDTISEVYTDVEGPVAEELTSFLHDGHKLMMVTGGDIRHVTSGITDYIEPSLRKNILVSHCSGAEVWGFNNKGTLNAEPFYSLYNDRVTPEKRQAWRSIMDQLIHEFRLRPHPVQNKRIFWDTVGYDPLDVLYDDRGPQITIGTVNAVNLNDKQVADLGYEVPETHGSRDLRYALKARADVLLQAADIPIRPNVAGTCSLDFVVEGVSKTTTVQRVLSSETILASIGLTPADIQDPNTLEVWGDKFSIHHGGTDRFMSLALPPSVRSIDFRQESPSDFPEGYNIVLWDGAHHLHRGLLEYLRARPRQTTE